MVSVQILRADDVGISIECEVSDTGVGISAALREILFRPFVQADVTMSRRHVKPLIRRISGAARPSLRHD